MKKKQSLVVVIAACVAMVLGGCGGSEDPSSGKSANSVGKVEPAKKYVIKAADGFPAAHVFTTNALKPFMSGVENATNGRVKFEHFPSGQLGKQADMLEILKSGVADFAFIGPSYMSGKLPLSSAFELPGIYPDAVVATEALLNLAQKGVLYDQEFSKQKVTPVLAIGYSPYNICGKKPIRRVADMKGLAIRGAGVSMELAVSALGGTLVNIIPQEMYEAALRGTVDGLALSIESWNSYKIQEVVKYATNGMNLTGWIGVYCFNDKTWKKFPDDIKNIIIAEGKKATNGCGTFIKTAGANFQKQFEKDGVVFNELTPDAKKEFRSVLQPVEAQWLKTMDGRGYDGKAVLAAVKAELAKVDAKHNKE